MDKDLNDEGDGFFYHEDEFYFILPLLVPDTLRTRLECRRTKRMYNDFAHLLFEEIKPAITGRPHSHLLGTPNFDWSGAQSRVSAVLAEYGCELPTPNEVTVCERYVTIYGT
ncbi:MAG: hypothetical protein ACJ8C4_03340 [Gemmataceae bacterium]